MYSVMGYALMAGIFQTVRANAAAQRQALAAQQAQTLLVAAELGALHSKLKSPLSVQHLALGHRPHREASKLLRDMAIKMSCLQLAPVARFCLYNREFSAIHISPG